MRDALPAPDPRPAARPACNPCPEYPRAGPTRAPRRGRSVRPRAAVHRERRPTGPPRPPWRPRPCPQVPHRSWPDHSVSSGGPPHAGGRSPAPRPPPSCRPAAPRLPPQPDNRNRRPSCKRARGAPETGVCRSTVTPAASRAAARLAPSGSISVSPAKRTGTRAAGVEVKKSGLHRTPPDRAHRIVPSSQSGSRRACAAASVIPL